MNLLSTISLYCGGPGSGCWGDNCGRKSLSPAQKKMFNYRMFKGSSPSWDIESKNKSSHGSGTFSDFQRALEALPDRGVHASAVVDVLAATDCSWITIHGQHICIKEGQSKSQAIYEHFKNLKEQHTKIFTKDPLKVFKDYGSYGAENYTKYGKTWGKIDDKLDKVIDKYKESGQTSKERVFNFLQNWVERTYYDDINKLVVLMQRGKTNPDVEELTKLSHQAQAKIGKGRDTITLYRSSSLYDNKGAAQSYSLSRKGVKNYIRDWNNARALDEDPIKSNTIRSYKIPVSNIVAYHKQWEHKGGSDNYIGQEEVIVSTKPLKI